MNLMDGVTVLSSSKDEIGIFSIINIIFIFIIIIALAIIGIYCIIKYKSLELLFFALIGILLMAIATRNYISYLTDDIYKVTISDNVKYNEFKDKFEILNQDGNIYTVKLIN